MRWAFEIQKGTERMERERRTGVEKRKKDSDRTKAWRGKDTGGPETKNNKISFNGDRVKGLNLN